MSWSDTVASSSTAPYFFAAEAVLPFLAEDDVRDVVTGIAGRFGGALLALDTAGPEIVGDQDEHDALSKAEARMQWACADPNQIAAWCPGAKVLASCSVTGLPSQVSDRLPRAYREMLSGLAAQRLPQAEEYRFNLLRLP
ncbi:hypothetical protein [Streptomyces sp. NPDC006285]|uniref:hypothetical protein n=1 Tax=Streptomyces sp. NPDC006285 TaxID=3364742 RepID=UPI0036972221